LQRNKQLSRLQAASTRGATRVI